MKSDDMDRIGEFLIRGDPGDDAGLSAIEVARMRRTILAGADREGASPRILWAAVAVTMVIAGVLFWQERPGAGRRGSGDPSTMPHVVARPSQPGRLDAIKPAHVIHFVTPSGTRVIWTLDDAMELPAQRTPGTRS